MSIKVIYTDKAPAAVGPYSQAIMAGSVLYSSGQLGLIPETGLLSEGIAAQTVQSLKNVESVLEEAGFRKEDVVKTTVFLTDLGNFGIVNKLYADFFGETKPARSCVEVSALPKGGLVEIEFTAVKNS
ncbi:MAG: RidA family protein [Firmicutes bacterium]|nr:RidA family protein [Bacillota bacterium]MBR0481208.1 RidA family protein [Bacillota bacterium]